MRGGKKEEEMRVGEEGEREREKDREAASSKGLSDCDKTGREEKKDGLEREGDEGKKRWRGGAK